MGQWTLQLGCILISITSLEMQWLLPQWTHSQGKCQVGKKYLLITAYLWVLSSSISLDFIDTIQSFGSANHWDDVSSRLPRCLLQPVLLQQESKSAGGLKHLHVALSAFPPISATQQAFLSATLCSAHKGRWLRPIQQDEIVFPSKQLCVKDFLILLKKNFLLANKSQQSLSNVN